MCLSAESFDFFEFQFPLPLFDPRTLSHCIIGGCEQDVVVASDQSTAQFREWLVQIGGPDLRFEEKAVVERARGKGCLDLFLFLLDCHFLLLGTLSPFFSAFRSAPGEQQPVGQLFI